MLVRLMTWYLMIVKKKGCNDALMMVNNAVLNCNNEIGKNIVSDYGEWIMVVMVIVLVMVDNNGYTHNNGYVRRI